MNISKITTFLSVLVAALTALTVAWHLPSDATVQQALPEIAVNAILAGLTAMLKSIDHFKS